MRRIEDCVDLSGTPKGFYQIEKNPRLAFHRGDMITNDVFAEIDIPKQWIRDAYQDAAQNGGTWVDALVRIDAAWTV